MHAMPAPLWLAALLAMLILNAMPACLALLFLVMHATIVVMWHTALPASLTIRVAHVQLPTLCPAASATSALLPPTAPPAQPASTVAPATTVALTLYIMATALTARLWLTVPPVQQMATVALAMLAILPMGAFVWPAMWLTAMCAPAATRVAHAHRAILLTTTTATRVALTNARSASLAMQ